MKTASPELVDKISEKYGDGSRVHEVPSEFADVKWTYHIDGLEDFVFYLYLFIVVIRVLKVGTIPKM